MPPASYGTVAALAITGVVAVSGSGLAARRRRADTRIVARTPRSLWAALAIVLATAAPAVANGRPPATSGVYVQPEAPQSLYVRTTFGLLISHDDGCSFRWVCEQNIGYGGTFDPHYEIADDGTIFATTFTGLRVSRDGGCSFVTATAELPASAPGRIADMWIDAIDIGPTGEVWVATADSGRPNDIYRSTDNGVTFESRGMLSSTVWWKSLLVAPSDPLHVYASGYEVAGATPTAYVYATVDGGTTWTPGSLAGVELAATPVVRFVAVDPDAPDHAYLLSVGANGAAGDRLYRTTDGGETFAQVLVTTEPVTNVVITGPTTVLVAAGREGAFRSQDGGATFAAIPAAPQLGCLAERSDGSLVGCGTNWDPDFMAVGVSDDAAQWQKVFRFIELTGPVECPAGTMGRDVCDEQMWPTLQAQFGATGGTCNSPPVDGPEPMPPPPPGGCCDAGGSSVVGIGLLASLVALVLRRRAPRRVTA